MHRLRCVWTGFIGEPGMSTFFFVAGTTNMSPLDNFLTAIRPYLPPIVTITPQPTGDIIEDTNGELQGGWTPVNTSAHTGTGPGTGYSAPTGVLIKWPTTAAIAGRRVVGKTFLVPVSASIYQPDGSITDSALAIIQQAARTMVNAVPSTMLVWARPFAGKAAVVGPPPRPAKPARLGQAVQIVTANVPDKVVVLRSRRD